MQESKAGFLLSLLGLLMSALIAANSFVSQVSEAVSTNESRLTQLEESNKVITEQIKTFQSDDKKLAEYLFRLEKRLAKCF